MRVWWLKPRVWAWLAGVLLALLLGISGLTGWLLRQQLVPLQTSPLVLDNGARVSVEAVQAGWFGTQVVLRMDWPLDNQRHLSVQLANQIDHGPFPVQRLAQFDLRPAALSDRVQLLSLELVKGEQRQVLPATFATDLRVSYLGSLQGVLRADTPLLPLGAWDVALEQLKLTIDGTSNAFDLNLQAQAIRLQPTAEVAPLAVTLRVPTLNLQAQGLDEAAQGLLQLTIDQFDVEQGGATLLRMNQLDQQASLRPDAKASSLALQASVSQLALWGQPVGRLSQSLSAEGLGLPALQQALGGQTQAWAVALPPASLVQGTLLALENADGTSAMRLNKPVGEQPLKVKANLSRSMFVATLARNPALHGQGEAITRQQALQLYALISQPLLQTGLFVSDAEGLSMALEVDAAGVRSTLPSTFLTGQP